jgi:hypothetical protein
MGAQNSIQQGNLGNPGQKTPGIFSRAKGFFRTSQQPGVPNIQGSQGLQESQRPQLSQIIDLKFILTKPPLPPLPPLQLIVPTNQKNQAQNSQILITIKDIMLRYNNNTWNFGNNKTTNEPQSLKEDTYASFLSFVTNLIEPSKLFIPPTGMIGVNAESFEGKKSIVQEIDKSIGRSFQLLNKFFAVKLSEIFTDIKDLQQTDSINVTLLGLAAIIGAEHLVIYFLMCGANPSLTYDTENKDSATLMLSYQLALSKLQGIEQQSPVNPKYFIILPRILYILFLLGSIGEGVDLSAIFLSNELKNKTNLSGTKKVQVKSSILNMLAIRPGSSESNKKTQTLQNGGSIPLLLEILEMNNSMEKPNFFKDINSLEEPYSLTVLYNVLMNKSIDDKTKLRLIELLVIKYCGNISTVPTLSFKNSRENKIGIILSIINKITTNDYLKAEILQIFSSNQAFKNILNKSDIKTTTNNKNIIIAELQERLKIFEEKNSALSGQIQALIELQQQKIMAEIANSQTKAYKQSQLKQSQPESQNFNAKFNSPSVKAIFKEEELQKQQLQQLRSLAGGKKIQMRTYHFLKYKKYSERAFIAERPIIAAGNAYDFMKLHYDIGDKQVTFTIHDRQSNKKYKYIAKTLKDGTNIIKTAK